MPDAAGGSAFPTDLWWSMSKWIGSCHRKQRKIRFEFFMPERILPPDSTASTNPANKNGSSPEAAGVEVFAVYGAEPEIQAYAMAKYSRSALSMKDDPPFAVIVRPP